jgi:hypothetical protein
MWQVEVPLGEFYEAIVDAGRGAGYLALLTAIVREADSISFYEDISRYWDSLHDVTGPDVLFVLSGPDASANVNYHGVPDGREPVAYSSRVAAVVAARERPLRPQLSRLAAKAGTPIAPRATELARSQTLAISELRRRLGLSEHQLPCMHLAFIGCQRRREAVTIPLSGRTVYESVKDIVGSFDGEFATIRQLSSHLEQLQQKSRRSSPGESWHRPDGRNCSPEQLEAARAIVVACATAPSEPDKIASVRAECFQRLTLLKGTAEFRSLQRHIDIHLNHERALARIQTSADISAKTAALETAWEAVFRRSKQVTSVPLAAEVKHRIFIAYHSKDRWIAEYLHSALTRHAATFLDVRCLRPGDRWVDRIRTAQDEAELAVILIGSSGGTSWFQQAEYLRAIELARTAKQRLIPVYINGAPDTFPYGLEGVQGVVTTWSSGLREQDVRRVAAEIAALLPTL